MGSEFPGISAPATTTGAPPLPGTYRPPSRDADWTMSALAAPPPHGCGPLSSERRAPQRRVSVELWSPGRGTIINR
jgi:hypothetical protein